MISLVESILKSVDAGYDLVKKQVEAWVAEQGLKAVVINPDCSITISGNARRGTNIVKGNIPDYIVLNSVQDLTITECTSLKNFPKSAVTLIITNSTFNDFSELDMEYCESLHVANCEFRSLKGLPKDCKTIYLGNNKNHIDKKDIKKLVNTKPQDIHTLGYYSTSCGCWVLGPNDVEYCKKEMDELEKRYKKTIPQIDHMVKICRVDDTYIYFSLDFLPASQHFNGIAENSIYLTFKCDIEESTVEFYQSGHLDLTPKDKEGKYKYYVLKGFTAPYYDAGGNKFRKTRLDNFDADNVYSKTIDWIKGVVDAALEDQGGVLKRGGKMKDLATTIIEHYISTNLNIIVNEDEDKLKAYYEKYGEKWDVTHKLDDNLKKYETDDKTSNMKLIEVFTVTSKQDKEGHYVAKFYGGLNGAGNWRNYLKDIQKLIAEQKAYIIKLDVDVPDDVWTLYIGINKKD